MRRVPSLIWVDCLIDVGLRTCCERTQHLQCNLKDDMDDLHLVIGSTPKPYLVK